MTTELIHFDKARQELALASTIDEVKQIRDQAEAIRQYIKQQKGSFEMQNQAAEIKLRAERRAGEILRETELPAGARGLGINQYSEVELHDVTPPPKLEDLGISKIQSHRWQLEADIPEEKFEQFIAETKAKADELTSRAALGLAMKIRHEERKINSGNTEIPNGLFDVIVIDPPWPYGGSYNFNSHRVESPYPEMSIDEIMLLDVPSADNAIIWLWTTNTFMHEAYHILEAWGYEPKTILTWYKERTGVGYWLRGQTEHCLLAVSGKPQITHEAQGTFLSAKAGEHSEKPEEFYQLVESLCPGEKLEMFARRKRDGWESHGNQIRGDTR
jgi:N6-adenosine-specific RNA methylase IME4